ncbi:protein phosphatase 1 regulatory subunit 12A isoform X2 [Octopus bimaculoides]|uniref:protein phosphatase 1 regulatory subunit 12A isoform X2 n=1 Tax=Octopus bimaculoides TaxID=37653 RepID=UPI00071CB67B|nr:protein phosphatase 1 regulatory subunit 12A isoform X2 [Octopus bimaculoides]|eukprot:XP_014770254.1 PREDICTED: protein phosphatase 1 regulatory subunit 12A-like isoform X2 [Octopus bimaculoides]
MSKPRDKYKLTWKNTHPVSIKIRLLKVDVYNVYVSLKMKISELKDHLELVTGIPYSLQKLSYLDADLLDDTTLTENRILPKTEVDLDVWTIWREFVKAAIKGDVYEVFRLGVTHDTQFEAPTSQYILAMEEDVRRDWIDFRAFVALCIGANRGFLSLCKELVAHGVNLKAKTSRGRTALHIAASHGRQEIIDLLISEGIKILEKDLSGWAAINIAILFAKTAAEKQLGSIQSRQKFARLKTPAKSFRAKETDNSKITHENLAESLLKKMSKHESRMPNIERTLTSHQSGINKEGLKEDIEGVNEPPKTNIPLVEETSERFSDLLKDIDSEGLKENIGGVKEPPTKKLSNKRKSKISPGTESFRNIQVNDGLNKSSNACIIREKSNNLVETEVMWVNYNEHLEQEDYKEEEGEEEEEKGQRRRIGGGEGKGDKNEEKETIHSKDSLHDYLISLKSEESAVQYPAWAVDAHLKQIESVNNSAKLVLLKLQNHEVGKIS